MPDIEVDARPKWMPESMAREHAAILKVSGFCFNSRATAQWLWQRRVPDTSIRHDICYMGNFAGTDWLAAGVWVKACSSDTSNPGRPPVSALDVLDSSFVDDGLAHLQAILAGLAHNETGDSLLGPYQGE